MKYNFDKIIDRHHTDAIKIERIHEVLKRDDVIPMWIADMDFATPDFILDVIKQRFEHPILGYTERNEDWYQAIIEWQKNRFGWNVEHEWVNFVPGIVPGIAFPSNASPSLVTKFSSRLQSILLTSTFRKQQKNCGGITTHN